MLKSDHLESSFLHYILLK